MFTCIFFFSSRRRHTRCYRDWSSDVCSSDLSFGDRVPALVALPAGKPLDPGGGIEGLPSRPFPRTIRCDLRHVPDHAGGAPPVARGTGGGGRPVQGLVLAALAALHRDRSACGVRLLEAARRRPTGVPLRSPPPPRLTEVAMASGVGDAERRRDRRVVRGKRERTDPPR